MQPNTIHERTWLPAVCLLIAGSTWAQPSTYVPVKWERFVAVDGQPLPVPEQWLDTEEARIAYSLKVPDSVPKLVPFDFKAAGDRSLFTSHRDVAVKYFDHLCATEAGQWIFRTVKDVEGLYFARPQSPPTTDTLTDPYGPEMPWIQRWFMLQGNGLQRSAGWLIEPPHYNYLFVEQPRRDVAWQRDIKDPYVRLFGLTRQKIPVPGVYKVAPDPRDWFSYQDKDPMRATGIATPTARYAYTWRGIMRKRDREFHVAGGEALIYDRQTYEVLAVRRQFLIATPSRHGKDRPTLWEIAAKCPQLQASHGHIEFSQFAFDALQTIEPSTTGR